MKKKEYRILISGGGTGGHIFPALSIANALKERLNCEILFVGADNRMEMERIPDAGYKIVGLPVVGFDRRHLLKNISVLFKLNKSLKIAKKIVKDFKPDIAIGVGGYCSGPTLKAAQRAGVPTMLQEQNSYAGVTNKLLAKKAEKICVAYPAMDRFFPAEKIIETGNPVRKTLLKNSRSASEARESFGLDGKKKTILVIGGSLGALTVNRSMEKGISELVNAGLQVIWQTGKSFFPKAKEAVKDMKGVVVTPFVSDMASAYSAATIVVSRAGAGSISELELLGKPVILIPSPNVAEDHQTKNAMALVERDAAIIVKDNEASENLIREILSLCGDEPKIVDMSRNIRALAYQDSDSKIVDEVIKILECNE